MSRTNVPEKDREDFFLFVDEFQNFTSDSFASILSEARKYHLALTLSHQHVSQLRENIRESVFGNVGSMVAFRVGSADAEMLAREFDGEYPSRRFTQLDQYKVCAKLLNGGGYSQPFFGVTLPPIAEACGHRDKIIQRSREKYSSHRKVVEEKIERWMDR
jgi:hypothetical protein